MLVAIRVFQIIIMVLMILKPIIQTHRNESTWNFLRISTWVFYICGVSSFSLAFGIAANLEDQDISQYPICLLFSAACIFSAIMMIVQSVWQIKYNTQTLVFRNSLGITKKYDIKDLSLVEGNRTTRIVCNGNTIAKWDSSIMNVKDEIALYRTLRH